MTAELPVDLTLATNMFGPLDSGTIARLAAVIDNPTQETWEDTHGIILNGFGMLTLWQAVIAVDPSFPRTGPAYTADDEPGEWQHVPSAEVIRQAINYATR